jgi:arylsulfatase A-like enzyme
MPGSRAVVLRAEDISMGMAGAALLLPTEILMLSRTPTGGFASAAWAVAGLFAGLGVLIGLGLAAGSALAARIPSPRWEPLARAAPSLLVLFPTTRTLFDGAWASTWPGARFGFLWAPVVAYLLVALAVHVGLTIARRPVGRSALAIALPGLAIEFDLFNRGIVASEYADLHTLLLVVSCVLGGLGLRFLVDSFRPFGWHWPEGPLSRRLAGATGGAAAFSALALVGGLGDKASRRAIADDGMHGRLLDRAAKAMFDFDGDGHATVLGGGDCAGWNGSIHPGAPEIAGNGIDEDCDGADDAAGTGNVSDEARRRRIGVWRQDPAVKAVARRLARLNVVLVAVDALRADPFVPKPENARAFPNLFALRRRASWFTRAFSPAAGTDLSMAGVMTGRVNPLSGSELTLAEGLGAAGYQTHAVVPAEVMRSASRTLLSRGFASLDVVETDGGHHVPRNTSADRTTALSLGFIDRWKKSPTAPFFVWAHYFDVHEHDQLPSDEASIVAANQGVVPKDRTEKYRALLSVVDGAIGRLRAGLEARGLAENTAFVFLSDHGESLREERRLPENHGRFLYNPLVHVPLAIVLPGIESGELSAPVSLLDVSATFLDLVGATAAAGEIEGQSLLPLLLGAPPSLLEPPRTVPLNETDQFGVIAWPHKLLVRPEANLVELYDLSRDFGEQTDQAEAEPELVRWLQHAYHLFPAIKLDRTTVARRRWEIKAEATRPAREDLQRLSVALHESTGKGAARGWQPGGRPAAADPTLSALDADGEKVARVKIGHRMRGRGASEAELRDDETLAHSGIVIEPLSPRRHGSKWRRAAARAAALHLATGSAAGARASGKPASGLLGSSPGPYSLAAARPATAASAGAQPGNAAAPVGPGTAPPPATAPAIPSGGSGGDGRARPAHRALKHGAGEAKREKARSSKASRGSRKAGTSGKGVAGKGRRRAGAKKAAPALSSPAAAGRSSR